MWLARALQRDRLHLAAMRTLPADMLSILRLIEEVIFQAVRYSWILSPATASTAIRAIHGPTRHFPKFFSSFQNQIYVVDLSA